MEVLLSLILAHLMADFVFQKSSWIERKEEKGFRSLEMWLHGLIHFACAALIVARVDFLPLAAVLAMTHLVIDIIKISQKSNKRFWFVFDQFLHLLSIIGISMLFMQWTNGYLVYPDFGYSKMQVMAVLVGYVLVTTPASYLIRVFISNWERDEEGLDTFANTLMKPSPEEDMSTWIKKKKDGQPEQLGLKNAGFWIGILERVLSFTFIIIGQFSAVAFLIGAKSVFRFGDMKEDRQIGFTEYVLIGTLLSFGIAIFAGLMVNKLLQL